MKISCFFQLRAEQLRGFHQVQPGGPKTDAERGYFRDDLEARMLPKTNQVPNTNPKLYQLPLLCIS